MVGNPIFSFNYTKLYVSYLWLIADIEMQLISVLKFIVIIGNILLFKLLYTCARKIIPPLVSGARVISQFLKSIVEIWYFPFRSLKITLISIVFWFSLGKVSPANFVLTDSFRVYLPAKPQKWRKVVYLMVFLNIYQIEKWD